jgi:hypothetical protein
MRDRWLLQWLRAFAQITTVLGVAMIGVIWSGVYYLGTEERERAYQEAQRQGSNLSRVFAEYIARVIRGQTIANRQNLAGDETAAVDGHGWLVPGLLCAGFYFAILAKKAALDPRCSRTVILKVVPRS